MLNNFIAEYKPQGQLLKWNKVGHNNKLRNTIYLLLLICDTGTYSTFYDQTMQENNFFYYILLNKE